MAAQPGPVRASSVGPRLLVFINHGVRGAAGFMRKRKGPVLYLN